MFGGVSSWIGLVAIVLASLATGGLLGVVLKYRLEVLKLSRDGETVQRDGEREDFKMILGIVTEQRDRAMREVEEVRDRQEKQDLEIQGLRLAHDLDPFASWIVDLEGHFLYVNREFERVFLYPDKSYRDLIGEEHSKLWPEAFCQCLKRLDGEARRRPDGRARATTSVEDRQVTVHKFPIRVRGVIVAYQGFITEIEDLAS